MKNFTRDEEEFKENRGKEGKVKLNVNTNKKTEPPKNNPQRK